MTKHTLRVPGATLYYELRGDGPLVVLAGSPMNADSFAPAAELLADTYTVLTTDPRGINRSPLDDPEQASTGELRGGDLAALIEHTGKGPALAAFGSSGGAVSVLGLAQAHPGAATTVIAHEPPLVELLKDRDDLHAGTEEMIAVYLSGDTLGAWAKFMAQADIVLPDGVLEMMFGGERDPHVVADERRWFRHELRHTTAFLPDLAALRDGTRIVAAIGEDSAGQLCDRATRALAAELGIEPTFFPGGHTGFADDPASFATRLRAVLA
ncbi:alpha/beta hydrolase [Nonomuraea sp. NBC_01738]|uniref:alpha/beta fold hydrolase n=1 Tax=Nonomuraea sp. NBC_01738 TaxID=2976003 RepID=UPI002E0EDF9A|nr:alpha/beta hydrolase [Nonomuraea sp. NBC_01738]